MSAGCGHEHGPFDGMSDTYKRRLWLVILINATMFAVEMTAGQMARSQALQADALDFFADAVTYGISLAVIGASLKVRSMAAASSPRLGQPTTRPGISRSAVIELSLWKCPPKPRW